ncbi:hypothetical protein [Dysgonomonas capnocytophagoides]|uniref:hypothetical protein n=1 Tax=Dysgonomonas capnocytophagoides TaxID=45254 RepID=UPI0003FB4CD0|nr:hypothetical protein [Dysgonomonas capnocytophagoides]
MNSIEQLRSDLIRKELNYTSKVGRFFHRLVNGKLQSPFTTPPMLRYTLSDPDKIDGYVSVMYTGRYSTIVDGHQVTIIDPDWDTYMVELGNIALPMARNFIAKLCMFGNAYMTYHRDSYQLLGYYKAPDEYTAENPLREYWGVLPEKTNYILIPVYKPALLDNIKNITLSVIDFLEWDITDFIHSDTELLIKETRVDTSGVTKEGTNHLKLVGIAKTFVEEVFKMSGFRSRMQYNVYKRKPVGREYELIKTERMDFQSIVITQTTAEVQGRDMELTELLKSNGKTKYDIPVSELRDGYKWLYNRVTMENRGNYEIPVGKDYSFNTSVKPFAQPYISLVSSEMTPGTAEHDMKSQESGDPSSDKFFFEADDIVNISLNMDFIIRRNNYGTSTDYSGKVILIKNNDTDNPLKEYMFVYKGQEDESQENGGTEPIEVFEAIVKETVSIPLVKGDKLSICVRTPLGYYDSIFTSEFNELKIVYTSKGSPITMDVITPDKLANSLLKKITNAGNKYQCEFDWGDLEYKPMFCAAETIRGFSSANFHGSMSDFMEWMKVMGYEYVVEDYQVRFAPRDSFYQPETTTLDLGRYLVDWQIEGIDDFAYTSVQVGYDKQDYESANGRFEMNGTFEYSTEYSSAVENPLKLISPYRADAIGIELLCWERKSTNTDTSSDNDVFVIAMTENENNYTVYEGLVYSPIDAYNKDKINLFNAILNPAYLVKRNESLIGITAPKLRYASTTNNRSVKVFDPNDENNPTNIFSDIDITKKLFEGYLYKFSTAYLLNLPNSYNWNGLVRFSVDGVVMKGYIRSIVKDYFRQSATDWELYAYIE